MKKESQKKKIFNYNGPVFIGPNAIMIQKCDSLKISGPLMFLSLLNPKNYAAIDDSPWGRFKSFSMEDCKFVSDWGISLSISSRLELISVKRCVFVTRICGITLEFARLLFLLGEEKKKNLNRKRLLLKIIYLRRVIRVRFDFLLKDGNRVILLKLRTIKCIIHKGVE